MTLLELYRSLKSGGTNKEIALQLLIQMHWFTINAEFDPRTGEALPQALSTFLIVSSAKTMRMIAGIQPSFLADIANIDTKRGHGNQHLSLPKADIGKLRTSALSTIKTLQEA